MKRFTVLILALIILTGSVFADSEFVSFGFSGGYTNIQNAPTFGFHTKYQGVFDIAGNVSFGLGVNGDFSFVFSNGFSASIGVIMGPVLSIKFTDANVLNIAVAPGFYSEVKETRLKEEFVFFGIGVATDVCYTHFFGNDLDTGISLGARAYTSFYDFAHKTQCPRIEAAGYAALTLRFSQEYDSISYRHYR